jgi:hypothetical protein
MLIKVISAQEKGITLDGESVTNSRGFIILIDGKLPPSLSVAISWAEATERKTLNYIIYYNENSFLYPSYLDSLSGATDIHIEITFKESLGYLKEEKHVYCSDLKLSTFRKINIITIANFNKKKNIYYIHYLTEAPLRINLKWKKEYGNKRKFEKKVFKGLYPLTYIKIEGVNGKAGKPYPIY